MTEEKLVFQVAYEPRLLGGLAGATEEAPLRWCRVSPLRLFLSLTLYLLLLLNHQQHVEQSLKDHQTHQ